MTYMFISAKATFLILATIMSFSKFSAAAAAAAAETDLTENGGMRSLFQNDCRSAGEELTLLARKTEGQLTVYKDIVFNIAADMRFALVVETFIIFSQSALCNWPLRHSLGIWCPVSTIQKLLTM